MNFCRIAAFSEERVHEIIENFPRGYFLDNRLVIYQGENVAEGESWTLKPENYKFVCSFYSDLCRILRLTPKPEFSRRQTRASRRIVAGSQ